MSAVRLTRFSGSSPEAPQRPIIVLIPGGPGLSSHTLGPAGEIQKHFDVVLIDPPGTAGLGDPELHTFEDTVGSIAGELAKISRPLVVSGHSFGGFYAAQLCFDPNLNVVGFVAQSTVLTPNSVYAAMAAFEKGKTEAVANAEKNFGAAPTNENLIDWLVALTPVYFSESFRSSGPAFLRAERPSAKAYAQVMPYIVGTELPRLTPRLRFLDVKKILVHGDCDPICPTAVMESDALAIGAVHQIIPGAGHFIGFENPAAVADVFFEHFAGN